MATPASVELYDLSAGSDCTAVKKFFSPESVSIGRGPSWSVDSHRTDSGLFRSDFTKSMSQKHATLTWIDGQPFLEDLKSTNGTWIELNGRPKRQLGERERLKVETGQVLVFGKEITGTDKKMHLPLRLKVAVKPAVVDVSGATSVQEGKADIQFTPTAFEETRVSPSSSAGRKSSGTYGLPEDLSEDERSDMQVSEEEVEIVGMDDSDEVDEEIDDDSASGYPRGTVDHNRDPLDRLDDNLTKIARERGLNVHKSVLDLKCGPPALLSLFGRQHSRDSIDSSLNRDEGKELVIISDGEDQLESAKLLGEIELAAEDEDEEEAEEIYTEDDGEEEEEELEEEELEEDEAEEDYDDGEAMDFNESDEDVHNSDESDVEEEPINFGSFDPTADDTHREVLEKQHALRMASLALIDVEAEKAKQQSDSDEEDEDYSRSDVRSPIEVFVCESEEDDEDETLSAPVPSQVRRGLVMSSDSDSDDDLPLKLSSKPPGRIPSPFVFKEKSTLDAAESVASTLPSPAHSPEQIPRSSLFLGPGPLDELALRHRREAEAERRQRRIDGFLPKPRRSPFTFKSLARGRKPGAFVGWKAAGTIRRPRIIDDSDEEDEVQSQASHLPSPSSSSREHSIEADERQPKRNKREDSAKKDKAISAFIEIVNGLHQKSEVEFDGLDEVDAEALQEVDLVESDADSVKVSDEEIEVTEEVDVVKIKIESVADIVDADEDEPASTASELKAVLPMSSPVKSPISSPSKRTKRGRVEDELESVEEVIDKCVAHVAKEALAAQLEPVFVVDNAPAPIVESVAAPVDERLIAPLPKRAGTKMRTALTFLGGVATAVVTMECLGILAGFMDE